MRRFLVPVLIATVLTACATSSAPRNTIYGNFIKSPLAANDKVLADDAAKQIIAVYPPGLNGFDLQLTASDAFGYYLFEQLRSQGYALKEHILVAPTKLRTKETGAATAPAAKEERIRLGYVVDLASAPNLYRVTLLVGEQSLTRAYLAQDGSIFPAGAWVRKE